MTDFNGWHTAVLYSLGVSVGNKHQEGMLAVHQAEGGGAKSNPCNTSRKMPGSTDYNKSHVQNYTSRRQGIEATILTIKEYPDIMAYLRKDEGEFDVCEFAHVWCTAKNKDGNTWGTSEQLLKEVLACLP